MAHRPTPIPDERLEHALRSALLARDPGPPAPGLGERVTREATAEPATASAVGGARLRVLGAPARGVAAVGAVAAALAAITFVLQGLHRSSAPGVAGGQPASSWPELGFVPAVQPALAALLLALAELALFAAWVAAPALGRRLGSAHARAMRAGAVVLALGLGVAALLAAVAPSMGPGNAWGGDDPRLLAIVSGPPDEPDRTLWIYAYGRGAEIRFMISLENTGRVPLTVLGLGDLPNPFVASLVLRLPPGGPTLDGLPLRPGEGSDRWFSEPFVPFQLAPGEQTMAALAVRLVDCPGMSPLPTRAPGAAIATEAPTGAGFGAVSTLLVRYSALGIERVAQLDLPVAINVAVGGDAFSCAP